MNTKSIFLTLKLLTVLLLVSACKSTPLSRETILENIKRQDVFAIKNVNVIPMNLDGHVFHNATVVIQNKRIVSLNGKAPANAVLIDGKGKWLIPGLIDMHTHSPADISFRTRTPTQVATFPMDTQDALTPYVANGITTILELNSRVGHLSQRNEISKGQVIGPRMGLAALIDGNNRGERTVDTPETGRQAVRSAKIEEYDYIKVYSHLNTETFEAVVDEARIQGMKVVGHIPNAYRGKFKDVFIPHFSMISHTEEFAKHSKTYSDEDAYKFAKLAKDSGVWVTPTLTAMVRIAEQTRSLDDIRMLKTLQYVHPILQSKWLTSNNYYKRSSPKTIAYIDNLISFNKKLVKAFKKVGVPMVAGTDALTSSVVPGFSLHDELELLVEAGLTQEEALNSATRLAATWLGIESEIGTIEEGKFADLVLLDANPFDDIKNTQKIAGVFVNGRWLSATTIDWMLSDLSKRFDAIKDQYEWKKRREY